jgi:hypothetical protein
LSDHACSVEQSGRVAIDLHIEAMIEDHFIT